MEKIKIYLIVGGKELIQDEKEISNFIRDLNDKYEKYNVYFKLTTDDSMKEINQKEIEESQLFFILFEKDITDKAVSKFNIAYDNFLKNKNPQIATYVKQYDGANIGESVSNFLKTLDESLGHYYSIYNNIDTIKLNLVLRLKTLGFGNLEVNDDKIYLDKKELLSLDNIPMIFNNKTLASLKEEAKKITDSYWEKKEDYHIKKDESLIKEIENLEQEKQRLENAIYEIENSMIELQTDFIFISSCGKLSKRQIYAQKCLEQGDIKEAKKALSLDEITSEAKKILKLKDNIKEQLEVKVNELLQRIQTLEIDYDNDNRHKEIDATYKEAMKLEKEADLYRKSYIKYINYLYRRRKYNEAQEIADKFIAYIKANELEEKKDACSVYEVLYQINQVLQNYEKADQYIEKVIKILENEEDDEQLACFYCNVACEFYDEVEQDDYNDKKIEYIKKAIELFKEKVKWDDYLAFCYRVLSRFYKEKNEFTLAEEAIDEALKIIKKLKEENSEAVYLSDMLYSMYYTKHHILKAEEKYEEAYDNIMLAHDVLKMLYNKNPREIEEKYVNLSNELLEYFNDISSLRFTNKNARVTYRKIKKQANPKITKSWKLTAHIFATSLEVNTLIEKGKIEKAENKLLKLLAKASILQDEYKDIRNLDIKDNVNTNTLETLMILNEAAGNLYSCKKMYEKALEYYQQELEIALKYLDKLGNYYTYITTNISDIYIKMANLNEKLKRLEDSKTCYLKALEIEEKIDSKMIFMKYRDYARFCADKKEFEEAITYYQKTIAIEEELLKEDFEKYSYDLMIDYHNIGYNYAKLEKDDEALEYYKKALTLNEDINKNVVESKNEIMINNLKNMYYRIYELYERKNDIASCCKYYEKYVQLLEEDANNDLNKKMEARLSSKYKRLAKFYETLKNNEKAEDYYLKYVDFKKEILEDDQENKSNEHNLAVANNEISIFYDRIGNKKKAIKYQEAALEIEKRLALLDPKEYNEQLLTIQNNVEHENLDTYYASKKEILKQIAKTSDNNMLIELNILDEYDKVINYYKDNKNHKEAIKTLNIMIELLGRLKEEGNYNYRFAINYNKLGQCYEQENEDEKSVENYELALDILEKLSKKDKSYMAEVAILYFNLGTIKDEMIKKEEAIVEFSKCIEILESLENLQEDEKTVLKRAYDSIIKCYQELDDKKNLKKYKKKLEGLDNNG